MVGDDDFAIGENPGFIGQGVAAGGCIKPVCAICRISPVDTPGMRCLNCMSPKAVSRVSANGDPIIWVEVVGPSTVTYEFQNIPNDQAKRIIQEVLPGVLELYLSKSRDYGGNVGDMIGLGAKATFVDIWRKVGKLKRALWDGQKMIGEQTEEILADLVGHVLIILDGMKRGN